MDIPIKFFPRDVVEGNPKGVGDQFKAEMFGSVGKFKVTEWHGDFFFAVMVD